MFERGGQKIDEVHLCYRHAHRLIFLSFYHGDKLVGREEMIGNFLTRHSFLICALTISRVLEDAGYIKYHAVKIADDNTPNLFMYRLAGTSRDRQLRHKGLPLKRIELACPSHRRTIALTYYVNDPEAKETADPKMLIELEKWEYAQIPTDIDFEFMAGILRRLFLTQENYLEIIKEPRFNQSFPDYFVFEFVKSKKSANR